jgi:hypothetical protein
MSSSRSASSSSGEGSRKQRSLRPSMASITRSDVARSNDLPTDLRALRLRLRLRIREAGVWGKYGGWRDRCAAGPLGGGAVGWPCSAPLERLWPSASLDGGRRQTHYLSASHLRRQESKPAILVSASLDGRQVGQLGALHGARLPAGRLQEQVQHLEHGLQGEERTGIQRGH